jgi:hypothetical protein
VSGRNKGKIYPRFELADRRDVVAQDTHLSSNCGDGDAANSDVVEEHNIGSGESKVQNT